MLRLSNCKLTKCFRDFLLKNKHIKTKTLTTTIHIQHNMDRVMRIWYLSPMGAAKVQASLRIRAISPEPLLLAHTSSESRGTFRQKARSLAPLNGWACAVKICHDGMLEDTNSLDGAHIIKAINAFGARPMIVWCLIPVMLSISVVSLISSSAGYSFILCPSLILSDINHNTF